MKIKVSDYIAKFIAKQNIKDVFLISGGANVALVDSIAKNKKLNYVCNHHEQACSMAAEGYARVNENIGVCVVTTGPAGINTLTGVFGAWADSIPMAVITGQVKRRDINDGSLRQFGVQEVDIVAMAKPVTKFAVTIDKAENVDYFLEKSFFLAKSGRPGPVLLNIPSDIQATVIDTKDFKKFDLSKEKLSFKIDITKKDDKKVEKLLKLLQNSTRPLIISGHGIALAGARKEIVKLIEKLEIPVVSSMSGHDTVPTAHPLYIGRHGVFGNRTGNFAVQSADLVITIGSRNHLWNIGYDWEKFAPNATKVVVDIDKAELNKKSLKPDLSFNLDAKDFLKLLLSRTVKDKTSKNSSWVKKCQGWKEKYKPVLPEHKNQKKLVNSYYFTKLLSNEMKDDEVIFTGNGTAFTGTNQALSLKEKQRLHYNVGCASMGYDLPAAIGASIANDNKRILCLTGDGSLMMNLQELQTIVHYKLPVKIFVYNNGGYLAIKNTQNSYFNGDFNAVDAKSGVSFPDFKLISKAFDIKYIKIDSHTNLSSKIKKVLDFPGPVFCDLKMLPVQTLYPKVYSQKNKDGSMSSASMENMFPFLPEHELKEALNMAEL
jgi:acetolactate synthase-1/2/3 large subunit